MQVHCQFTCTVKIPHKKSYAILSLILFCPSHFFLLDRNLNLCSKMSSSMVISSCLQCSEWRLSNGLLITIRSNCNTWSFTVTGYVCPSTSSRWAVLIDNVVNWQFSSVLGVVVVLWLCERTHITACLVRCGFINNIPHELLYWLCRWTDAVMPRYCPMSTSGRGCWWFYNLSR